MFGLMAGLHYRRNASGRGGYFKGERISLAYRGFKFWGRHTYISLTPLRLGTTRLYLLGPLALYVHQKESS